MSDGISKPVAALNTLRPPGFDYLGDDVFPIAQGAEFIRYILIVVHAAMPRRDLERRRRLPGGLSEAFTTVASLDKLVV